MDTTPLNHFLMNKKRKRENKIINNFNPEMSGLINGMNFDGRGKDSQIEGMRNQNQINQIREMENQIQIQNQMNQMVNQNQIQNKMNQMGGMGNQNPKDILMMETQVNAFNNMMNSVLTMQQKNASLNYMKNLANQMQLNNSQIINNQNANINNEEGVKMSLIFKRNKKKKTEDFKITIFCNSKEKLKDVTARYLLKILEDRKNVMFFFNGKKLDENKTIEEMGLIPNSIIFVEDVDLLPGGK